MNSISRTNSLRQRLIEKNLDGVFISQPENRFYLSGFNGSAGYLLVTPKLAILATDFRYFEQSGIQAPDYTLFPIAGKTEEWFPRLIGDISIKRLGFEADNLTVSFGRQLTEALHKVGSNIEMVPVDGLVDSLRVIKEPAEIDVIEKAVKISDQAIEYIAGVIQPGMTEKEVAWKIEKFMRENGSQPLPFDIIVAAGPNSALPHAQPSERKINPGEPIVMDFGAKVGGYASDITRTICLGTPDANFRKIYDTVLGAQLTALSLIQEGVTGEAADSYARTVIKEAGQGEKFGHSLGHGVGLAVHESPRLGPNSPDILKSGMVFSVEPGVYIPGWGGVRIEDLVTIQDGKLKVLSQAAKIGL